MRRKQATGPKGMSTLAKVFLGICLAGIGSFPCAADSIQVGGKTFDDVYITEDADYYHVANPADGSLQRVSKRRSDVREMKKSDDPAARAALLEQWKKRRADDEKKAANGANGRKEAVGAPKTLSLKRDTPPAEYSQQGGYSQMVQQKRQAAANRPAPPNIVSLQGTYYVKGVRKSPQSPQRDSGKLPDSAAQGRAEGPSVTKED